jgi:hypothetical protein
LTISVVAPIWVSFCPTGTLAVSSYMPWLIAWETGNWFSGYNWPVGQNDTQIGATTEMVKNQEPTT